MGLAAAPPDAPDAREPAEFCLRLLPGRRIRRGEEGPDRVHIRPPDGSTGLSFRSEPAYLPSGRASPAGSR